MNLAHSLLQTVSVVIGRQDDRLVQFTLVYKVGCLGGGLLMGGNSRGVTKVWIYEHGVPPGSDS